MKIILSTLACLLGASAVQAQLAYPGCAPLQTSEFQKASLFSLNAGGGATVSSTLSEPVAMSFQAVKTGDSVIGADIYFVQRKGSIRKYDFLAKTVKEIGFINNAESVEGGQGDNGVMGVALDPDFTTNRWIYIWYSPPRVGSNNYRGRLSRFNLGLQDTLLPSSEKILLDVKLSKTRQWHGGGPMRFDAHGDLWLTIGNNGSDLDANTTLGSQYSTDSTASQEWGSSSTASMRGGVMRIHPDNSAKGYSIPPGNFGEYWANHFQTNGNPTLATQYRDTAKVLPEIYVKGTRSNYSITVHPTKRWLAWGEVNWNGTSDEFNLISTPAFTGFPYFHANNVKTPGAVSPAKDTLVPLNVSSLNSGVTQLPPARRAALWYGSSVTASTLPTNVAIGGDIYTYDRNLKSGVKFPPHFHNTWLLMSWQANSLYAVGIDSAAVTVNSTPLRLDNSSGIIPLTSPTNLRNPVQASYGPDGALYIMNYGGAVYTNNNNPGVFRVTYSGSCKLDPVSITTVRPLAELRINLNGSRLQILEAARHEVILYSSAGREVFRAAGNAGSIYNLSSGQGSGTPGVYILQVKTSAGTFSRNLPLL